MALQSGNYVLDAQHSTVGFTVHHAVITKVHGQFIEFESVINSDADNSKNSMAKTTIQANFINTNNEERGDYLCSKDFFGTDENPTFEFVSTAIELQSKEKATVTGNLTINGITKSVTLDADIFGSTEDLWGQTRVGFEAATKIDRIDFSVDYSASIKTGGLLLGNGISPQVGGSAVKQQLAGGTQQPGSQEGVLYPLAGHFYATSTQLICPRCEKNMVREQKSGMLRQMSSSKDTSQSTETTSKTTQDTQAV